MTGNIDNDYKRFRDIVKGNVRKNLKQYITNGQLIGKEGKDTVKIPLPQIDLPKFVYDDGEEGIGQGEGDEGDKAPGEAGDKDGEITYDAEMSLEDLADIMGENLELAELKPKSIDRLLEEKDRYKSTRRAGPESLRHFRRTYTQALKRMISTGEYNSQNPKVIPIRADKVYRSWISQPYPSARALVIHGRDISGSIDENQIDIIKNISWWIDLWIRTKYKDRVQHAYIAHHASAQEFSKEDFFRISDSSGGTVISSAFELMSSLFLGEKARYNHNLWNIYVFYYSDGDNFNHDMPKAMKILEEGIFPYANSFCYGNVSRQNTNFNKELKNISIGKEHVRYADIPNKDQILEALRSFLGPKK